MRKLLASKMPIFATAEDGLVLGFGFCSLHFPFSSAMSSCISSMTSKIFWSFSATLMLHSRSGPFIARQRSDIGRAVQERGEVFALGAESALAEMLDSQERAQLLGGGGGEQLVRGHAFFGGTFAELPGEALGHLDGQRAHVSFSISL